MCPGVSLCQRPRKGRPKGVVLHFYSFINSPFCSDCVCHIGQNGRRDKEVSGGMGGGATEFTRTLVNNDVSNLDICFFLISHFTGHIFS